MDLLQVEVEKEDTTHTVEILTTTIQRNLLLQKVGLEVLLRLDHLIRQLLRLVVVPLLPLLLGGYQYQSFNPMVEPNLHNLSLTHILNPLQSLLPRFGALLFPLRHRNNFLVLEPRAQTLLPLPFTLNLELNTNQCLPPLLPLLPLPNNNNNDLVQLLSNLLDRINNNNKGIELDLLHSEVPTNLCPSRVTTRKNRMSNRMERQKQLRLRSMLSIGVLR